MTKNELIKLYFKWMCSIVYDVRPSKKPSYKKLMRYLHSIEFRYILPMDGNRASDGEDLRYRFAYEERYEDAMIASYLDDRPCSVLEMMIALALRCEEHIMDDPDMGDRTGQWFWNMIVSLGLGSMHDDNFDEEYVDEVIERFMDRCYSFDGEGGLFTIRDSYQDLRNVEIWHQMCWYLNDLLERG